MTTRSTRRAPSTVGLTDPVREPPLQHRRLDDGPGHQHGLLDQPPVTDGHHVAERRWAAGPAPEVHQHDLIGGPVGDDDAEGRLPGHAGRGRTARRVDDEPGVVVAGRREHTAAPAEVLHALGPRRDDLDAVGEMGTQGVVVDDAVRAIDDVAVAGVDDHGRRDVGEAGVGERRHVVAPHPVRRRPGARRCRPRRRPARHGGTPPPAPGRPGRRRSRRRRGQAPARSRTAIRRNCSTTSGGRWPGSSVR